MKRQKVCSTSLLKRKSIIILNNYSSGTTCTLIKTPPHHIKDAGDFEPLYPPQEFILEETLRREAERVAHQESLLNRVVFDAIDPSPYNQ